MAVARGPRLLRLHARSDTIRNTLNHLGRDKIWLTSDDDKSTAAFGSSVCSTRRSVILSAGAPLAASSEQMDQTEQGTPSIVAAFVTVPSADVGKAIASHLVKEKLAACCNMIPGLTSIYWWDGKVAEDSELLLMIKSRSDLISELTTAVEKMHPYDTCEVIALPIEGGSEKYIKWVLDSTKSS